MKTIVIAGDSWGAGEWINLEITHSGLAQYFVDDGFNVVNLSQPGNGPFCLLQPLSSFLEVNKKILNIQHVFLLQSDIGRDFKKFGHSQAYRPIDWNKTKDLKENIKKIYRDFYSNLNHIGQNWGVTIHLIGGLTDLVMDFAHEFDYVNFLVPSWVQLIEPTASPVFLFSQTDIPDYYRDKQQLLSYGQSAVERFDIFCNSQFFPDNGHPGRDAHKLLHQHLHTLGLFN